MKTLETVLLVVEMVFMTPGPIRSKDPPRNYLGSLQHQTADPHKLSSPTTKEEHVPFLLPNLTGCPSLAAPTQTERKGPLGDVAPSTSLH